MIRADSNNSPLTIGQVAKLAGINLETVRFYERKRLIPKPPRKTSGYRQYPQEVVDRILFIRRAKDLGFSLNEIADLLSLRLDKRTKCNDVKQKAENKIEDIESKIKTLKRMKKALVTLTIACIGKGTVSDCPILESLAGKGR